MRLALQHVQGSRVLVLNGDSYCRFDVKNLLQVHERTGAAATLWLTPIDACDRFGAVQLGPDSAITRFHEKQTGLGAGTISAGVYLLERSTVAAIPVDRPISIEHDVFPNLIGKGLYSVIGQGPFLDIGTPESYAAANEMLGKELARFGVG